MQRIYLLSVLLVGCIACDGVEETASVDNTELDAEGPQTEVTPVAPPGEAENDEHQVDDAWSKPASDPAGDGLTSAGKVNAVCACWTRCSSNGVGWTKKYYVGGAASKNDCSGKATAFCKGKSRSYKYQSSYCA